MPKGNTKADERWNKSKKKKYMVVIND